MDLKHIFQTRGIATHFQPLVSVRRKKLMGFEALSRGIPRNNGTPISPGRLFGMAQEQGCTLELDRLCRDVALETFAPYHRKRKDLLISLNMDTAVLDSGAAGSNYLKDQADRWGVAPNNIIIEILEAKVTNEEELLHFVATYREHGFLIGMDDVGVGHSNLERIARVRPDVIKLDRSLVSFIDREFYKQEVARALVNLSGQLGALCLAEGVERVEESSLLLELGVDVFQGFFFSVPEPLPEAGQNIDESVVQAAAHYRKRVMEKIDGRKRLFASFNILMDAVLERIEGSPPDQLDRKLSEAVTETSRLECVYILNGDGIQIGDTICNPFTISPHKRFIYQPAEAGADHSLKNYYLPLKAGLERFTTDSYISLASGNICTTMSAWFTTSNGVAHIICLDISQETDEVEGELLYSQCY